MNQDEKSRLSREKIISAAIKTFGSKPFDQASTTEMCRENGISKGRLYHHFKNKNELFLCAVERALEIIIKSYESAQNNFCADLKKNLIMIIEARSNISIENPYIPKIIWLAMQNPPPETKSEIREIVNRWHNRGMISVRKAFLKSGNGKTLDVDLCTAAVSMVFNHAAFNAMDKWNIDDKEQNRRIVEKNRGFFEKHLNIILYGVLPRE